VAIAISGAVAAGASGTSGFDWQRLHRPLRFPSVAAGVQCPTKGAAQAAFGQALNGRSPAYLMSVGGTGAGVIEVNYQYVDAKGWVGQKTPWLIDRRYTGPLLVRGQRLDEPGPVRFAKGYGQHLAELRFVRGEKNSLDKRFRGLASSSLFRSPGCYGFQIDGTSFSRAIVMRVIEV